jgi:hypothetical protein
VAEMMIKAIKTPRWGYIVQAPKARNDKAQGIALGTTVFNI